MKRTLAAIAAGTLLLAACSSPSDRATEPDPATTAAPTQTAEADASTTTAAPRSARNNIVKTVGELGGMDCQTGLTDCGLTFTVDSLTVDANCSTPEYTALAIDVSLTTNPGFDPNYINGAFQDDEWSIIGADGITRAGEEIFATPCSSDARLPNALAPASKYERHVLLKSPAATGTLQYVPTAYDGYSNTNGGWEWAF